MKPRPLLRVSVSTTPEAEDAVADLLGRVLGAQPSSYNDLESGELTVTAYLEDPGDWTSTSAAGLRQGLQAIRTAGLDIGPGALTVARLPARDWAESWKRHFHPLVIGRKLLVLPGWIKRKTIPGQKRVVLDPGLSFGTGHHPTTAFCLREIVREVQKEAARTNPTLMSPSFLDLGSGSGILSISAAKFVFSPVHALENDPDAVRIAKENARKNRVADRIRFECKDLRRWKPTRRYSLVCANLISDLLLQERPRIVGSVAPGGTLVLAGILRQEFAQVAAAYADSGARLERKEERREWCSGRFSIHF